MANKKITQLDELAVTPASGDKVPLVDVSDTTGAATGTTKWVSVDNLISDIAVADMAASAVVTESEGIGSNDNDTTLPTSAAVKDYVDTNVTAQDLDFQGDSGGALAIDLDSESLTIAGGTGISTVGATNTVTASIDSTVATLTGTQVLTNKTLTSPVIDTGVSGSAVLDSDAMSGASATTLATSESIKAYVDAQTHLELGTSSSTALAGDTTTISEGQATAITANTAKTTNATHTGEVTGATALTIADDTIDEANLKSDNAPTNDYVLTAKSSAAGGLKWAAAAGGGSGDITSVVAGTGLTGGATTGDATLNVDVGIADDKIAQIDSASVADDDFARFTASGLEGRSASEVLSDIGAAASGHAHGLNNLSDVSTTGEANGKIIKHNGSSWVIADDADTNTNQLTTFTVSATTDTNATTISQGDDLLFTAGTGITCETTADGTVTIANTVTNTDTKWDGGATGLTAGTGRTSLGLVIGTDVQAHDADTAKIDVKQDWTKAQTPATQTAAFAQPNFDTYQNFIFTLASGANALTDPTTESGNAGQTGVFIFIQPSSGDAGTVSMTSQWLPVGGSPPSLSSVNARVDVVPYMIQAADKVLTGAPQLNFT